MKKNKILIFSLGLWVLVICFVIGSSIFRDIKNIKKVSPNNTVKEEEFTINSSVGDFSQNEKEENKDENDKVAYKNSNSEKENINKKEVINKEEINNELENTDLKEIKIVDIKYGTVIYDEITYEIKNEIKNKKSVKRLIDNSNYNASLEDLKKEAINMVINNKNISNEVLEYTNKYRKEVGIKELILDDTLSLAANIRAMELAYFNVFSHTRPDGSNITKLASDLNINYNAIGENIAYGYQNSEKVTIGWRNSKGHYENMINENFHKIGIGSINFNGNTYWVQVFSN